MATARFAYFHGVPTVLVTLQATRDHSEIVRRLLVDSGFTGKSALVLNPEDADRVRRRYAPSSQVGGAIVGRQQRIWVRCSIPQLRFDTNLIAIATDLSSLSLPTGIDGLCGLSFLNLFNRWGAAQSASGDWSFEVEISEVLT